MPEVAENWLVPKREMEDTRIKAWAWKWGVLTLISRDSQTYDPGGM